VAVAVAGAVPVAVILFLMVIQVFLFNKYIKSFSYYIY
jgi:hypothetical protein